MSEEKFPKTEIRTLLFRDTHCDRAVYGTPDQTAVSPTKDGPGSNIGRNHIFFIKLYLHKSIDIIHTV